MMQQTHVTAWQAQAPWPKRSQIEQGLRLSRGLAAIFEDDVLREHLAMRGGTVLHKAHLAPAAYAKPTFGRRSRIPTSSVSGWSRFMRQWPTSSVSTEFDSSNVYWRPLRNALIRSHARRLG